MNRKHAPKLSVRRVLRDADYDYILAIDAATRNSGIALYARDPKRFNAWELCPQTWEIYGIENIAGGLALPGEMAEKKVFVLIECPTWKGHGTHAVRSAAVAFERALSKMLPKRSIKRIDPRTWQQALLTGIPGAASMDTKSAADWYVRRVLNIDTFDRSADEIDAICIGHYAQQILAGRFSQ